MKLKIFVTSILLSLFLAPATALADLSEALDYREQDVSVLSATNEHEPVTFITTSRLNLRTAPGTYNERIRTVNPGTRVEVLDFGCGYWFEVYHNGTTGFMYAAHLRELGDGTSAFGEVELLHWSYARYVMTLGTIATLIDVRTGLSWQVASFSNGNHADIETITAEDTAIKLQAFGSWTWTPRPVIVLINDRTIAASVNGMPHAGWTRSGNNMNGHVCLHFLGSTTHRPAAQHVRDHQNAVMEAYNTALTW
ncbi:MAG: SH3 domain-containing protein [Defluviitaleaceae bacterium]|nr:SH3 domain-containing protein [Defluviitaleaceae bacterium]MCL2263011.1 SH3 domain-containing protein [Defluviitaleaceae bacterium]